MLLLQLLLLLLPIISLLVLLLLAAVASKQNLLSPFAPSKIALIFFSHLGEGLAFLGTKFLLGETEALRPPPWCCC